MNSSLETPHDPSIRAVLSVALVFTPYLTIDGGIQVGGVHFTGAARTPYIIANADADTLPAAEPTAGSGVGAAAVGVAVLLHLA